ncbi:MULTISPECIES: hypothetical protein [Hymenobacter]|nr:MULTISPECIES: hypothetical protein [Hymenobacter]
MSIFMGALPPTQRLSPQIYQYQESTVIFPAQRRIFAPWFA